jgi:hypothetical protein
MSDQDSVNLAQMRRLLYDSLRQNGRAEIILPEWWAAYTIDQLRASAYSCSTPTYRVVTAVKDMPDGTYQLNAWAVPRNQQGSQPGEQTSAKSPQA